METVRESPNADYEGRPTDEQVRSLVAYASVHAMTGTGNLCERCGRYWTDEIHRWPEEVPHIGRSVSANEMEAMGYTPEELDDMGPPPNGRSEAGDAGLAG